MCAIYICILTSLVPNNERNPTFVAAFVEDRAEDVLSILFFVLLSFSDSSIKGNIDVCAEMLFLNSEFYSIKLR